MPYEGFQKVEASARASGARDPGAVAAAVGRKKYGKKKWRRYVEDVTSQLRAALVADYIVLGGGNAKKLKTLPPHCRLGDNSNAFLGGFRLWDKH